MSCGRQLPHRSTASGQKQPSVATGNPVRFGAHSGPRHLGCPHTARKRTLRGAARHDRLQPIPDFGDLHQFRDGTPIVLPLLATGMGHPGCLGLIMARLCPAYIPGNLKGKSGMNDQEDSVQQIGVTWQVALSVWWLMLWRMSVVIFVGSMAFGLLLDISGEDTVAGLAGAVILIIIIGSGLPIVKMALQKQYSEFQTRKLH